MRSLLRTIQTTVIGGLIFLVPLVVLVIVFEKAVGIMKIVARPFAHWIPSDTPAEVLLANLVALLVLLAICFVSGIIARGPFFKQAGRKIESGLLAALPGYAFVKGFTDSMRSSEDAASSFTPVIATFDDNTQLGFEIERSEATGKVVVYLPGSPNPWSGSVIYMEGERVHKVDIAVKDAINHIRHLGRGAESLEGRVQR